MKIKPIFPILAPIGRAAFYIYLGSCMVSGIYALYWWKQDLCYIGQAQNTTQRFREHQLKMRSGTHTNYKVQNSYNLYGTPEYILLEACPLDQLNTLEIVWTAEFNTVKTPWGLNIVEAGAVGWGTNSNSSKYTTYQILKIFSMLYRTTSTHNDIANRTKIPYHIITDIKSGISHLWLKESYPEQYQLMVQRDSSPSKLRNTTQKIKDPTGNTHLISNIREFVRSRQEFHDNFDSARSGLGRVLRGTRKQFLGWTLPTNTT